MHAQSLPQVPLAGYGIATPRGDVTDTRLKACSQLGLDLCLSSRYFQATPAVDLCQQADGCGRQWVLPPVSAGWPQYELDIQRPASVA